MINHFGEPDDSVALERLEHIPATPFYLQMHYKIWKKGVCVKECVNRTTSDKARKDRLNLCALPRAHTMTENTSDDAVGEQH